MNLRDLHYLVTVAECGQFARAATICNVSQPSLSIQLKKLEAELGISIFERSGRQLIVTQAGRAVIDKARKVLTEVNEMQAIAKNFSGDGAEFRLGVIPTIAPYMLPAYLRRLRKEFPALKIRLVEAQTHVLEQMLGAGELDAIIASTPLSSKEFRHAVLCEEKCYVALPAGHALAHRKKLDGQQLAHERLMLLDEGHCFRNLGLALCEKSGMQENIDFRSTSLETLRQMVASGEGLTLMPATAVCKNPKIAYVPCTEKGFERTVCLYWRSSTPFEAIIHQMKQIAREQYAKIA
jgi:LysR family hydrogen peroxide-inducible transcriptional activator